MADLRKVYVARGPGDAHLLRGLLESEGIRVVVRGDDFVPLQGGGLFHVETRPSVWVLDDEDLPRALAIVNDYRAGTGGGGGTPAGGDGDWTCPSCGGRRRPCSRSGWCRSNGPGNGSGSRSKNTASCSRRPWP